ncbi:MAG: NosD domain-containing protein [Candidatus Hodarchaeales archaeon]|jgi:parallel beta-helix repeat protein
MNFKKTYIIWFISIVILSSIAISGLNYSLTEPSTKITTNSTPMLQKNLKITSLIPYSPIYIDSNLSETATAKGWSGTGTAQFPFIIDGYNITGTDGTETLISISNTDLYFTIRNSSVHGGYRGIYLSNVDNGIVTDVVAYNNTDAGFYFTSVANINITSTIAHNNTDGYRLYGANNTIAGNNAFFNEDGSYGYGFYLSGKNKIFNNNATRNGKYSNSGGFCIWGAGAEVENNTAVNNGGYVDNILAGEGFRIGDNIIVRNNTAIGSYFGFHLRGGEYNLLINNYASFNRVGFYIWDGSNHNIVQNNFISNNERNGIKLCSTPGGCGGTTINNTIKDNFVIGEEQGIHLSGLNYEVKVINNTLEDNSYGLYIYDNVNITIEENNITNCWQGIYLGTNANNHSIKSNLIQSGTYGFYIDSSTKNNITNNILVSNSGYGIYLRDSPENRIYHNNFFYNSGGNVQAYANSASIGNIWSNNTHGNFWSNYLGIDANDDGIGDTPYNITGTNTEADPHPLMQALSIVDIQNPVLETPSDITYEEGEVGNVILWNATDDYPFIYVIFQNGTLIENGTWSSTTSIEINVDSLAIGTYNYTIVVYDAKGQSTQGTVIVTVTTVTISENIGQFAFLIVSLIVIYCIIHIQRRKKE